MSRTVWKWALCINKCWFSQIISLCNFFYRNNLQVEVLELVHFLLYWNTFQLFILCSLHLPRPLVWCFKSAQDLRWTSALYRIGCRWPSFVSQVSPLLLQLGLNLCSVLLGFRVSADYMQRLPILAISWQAALQTISPASHFDCSPMCLTNLCTQGICFLLISCLGTEGLMLTLCLSKQWVFHPVHGSTGWCLKMWDLMSVILYLHWRPCCGNTDLPVESIACMLTVALILGC